ncbi:MAG: glycosyltransferase family 2 protein [Candidatus Uhrbacteria bacterium]
MIYIIILSYQSPDDVRRCVESVLRTNERPERFRVVVVDNASTEDTRAALSEFDGRIDVILESENTGYAGGMNVGIRHALQHGAEYVVLLNQDTEVDPTWLTHLRAAMESDTRIAAAQPRIMYGGSDAPHDDLVNSVGNEIHVLGFGYAGGHGERWSAIRSRLHGYPYPEVTYCSGAAVMYRARALIDVALQKLEVRSEKSEEDNSQISTLNSQFFDEDYFLYHEDLDIGVRFWLRDWSSVLVPNAVVTHHYEFSRSIAKLYWMERNRMLFLYQNFRLPTLLLLALPLLVSELGMLMIARRGGWLKEKLRAWRSLGSVTRWHTYYAHRRMKQAKRMLPDRAIIRRLSPVLANQEVSSPLVDHIVNPLVSLWWRCVLPFIRW